MRRWGVWWAAVALLVGILVGNAPSYAEDSGPPPEVLRLQWLEPGALLVVWHQGSAADKVTVMRCDARNTERCVPYLDVFNRIAGKRFAVLPAQPGDPIRIAEWRYVGNGFFEQIHWTPPQVVPSYPTFLPVLR